MQDKALTKLVRGHADLVKSNVVYSVGAIIGHRKAIEIKWSTKQMFVYNRSLDTVLQSKGE
jgi:hypothetical protein